MQKRFLEQTPDGDRARKTSRARSRSRKQPSDHLDGMLIHAQEAERARIARELHDTVSQQAAALSISFSTLKRQLENDSPIALADICALQEQVQQLATEIRNVSHELHPGMLSRAGLEASVRKNCIDFSLRTGIPVQLFTRGDIDSVSIEIALCVYRIFQESLHNIQTHAHAQNVKVYVTRKIRSLELVVEDDGQGFDQEKAKNHGGLGFLSMDERVRLVRGRIKIQTQPSSGTNVQLQIPI